LKKLIEKNPGSSFQQLTAQFNRGRLAENKLSRSSIVKAYKKEGYQRKKAIKRPYLTKKQRKARLTFAREMRTINTDIVVYTDEKWFFANRRDQWVSQGGEIDESKLFSSKSLDQDNVPCISNQGHSKWESWSL